MPCCNATDPLIKYTKHFDTLNRMGHHKSREIFVLMATPECYSRLFVDVVVAKYFGNLTECDGAPGTATQESPSS